MAKVTMSHCNKCVGEKNHEVLYKEETNWHQDLEEGVRIDGGDIYEMVRCCGCDEISLRHRSWFSEDLDDNGNPITNTYYYPSAIYRQKPRWINDLYRVLGIRNNFVRALIHEIYIALQNDSLRLAAMGTRALLEHIMIDKVSDHGNFKKNLNAFHDKGFISDIQKKYLEQILEAGHATIHRSFDPSKEDLLTLMDVAESLIESIYINPRKADKLTAKIPPRIKKNK